MAKTPNNKESNDMSGSLSFLAGKVYTSSDGLFTREMDKLPESTVITALTRAFHHVMGNEAFAKVKNETDSPAKAAKIAEIRAKYWADMESGAWGSGLRAVRMPAANREEQIYNKLLAADTRSALNKDSRITKGEAEDTWVHPKTGEVLGIADWMAIYVGHSQVGESRKADLQKRAADKYAAELKDAEHRKATKATANAGFDL